MHAFRRAQPTTEWYSLSKMKKKLFLSKEEGGIGFKMIHEFNLELLEKQSGRLVQFPDSLSARVLI